VAQASQSCRQFANGDHVKRDMFQRVVDLAGANIPGVTEASVTVVQGTDAHTPACTGGLASSWASGAARRAGLRRPTTMAHDTNRTVCEVAQALVSAPPKPPQNSRLRPAGSAC
jgi:hypothetical protein